MQSYVRMRSLSSFFRLTIGSFITVTWLAYLSVALLHPQVFFTKYCEDCYLNLWLDPPKPNNKDLISYIRQHIVDPAQDQVLDPLSPKEYESPSWGAIGNWQFAQDDIRTIFAQRSDGVFVEVGAGDGVFLSHTAWLESAKGWKGLLLEPRQAPYESLRRRRKASSAQVCAAVTNYNQKEVLWSPAINGDDSVDLYLRVAGGKSTLIDYVATEDQTLGKTSTVQCITLDSLMLAAFGKKTTIDLLVLHTMGGEADILGTLQDLTVLVLIMRFHTKIDRDAAIDYATHLKMKLYKNSHPGLDNFIIFVHEDIMFIDA